MLALIYPAVHCLPKQKNIRADWIYTAYAATGKLMSLLIKGVKHHDNLEYTVPTCFISILTKQIQAHNFAGITSLKLKIVAFTTHIQRQKRITQWGWMLWGKTSMTFMDMLTCILYLHMYTMKRAVTFVLKVL